MKKNLEYYMGLRYPVTVIPCEESSGYVAYYPDLPGCITQADTWEELAHMLEDAKRCWISAALEDLDEIPEPKKQEKVA